MDVEAHRTRLRAFLTVDAAAGVGRKAERRPADGVPYLPADDHQDGSRAENAAEAAPAQEVCGSEDREEDEARDHQGAEGRDREPVLRGVEGIDCTDPAGTDEEIREQPKPEHRDAVLDPVAPAVHPALHDRRADLLPRSHRAEPAAPEARDGKREDEERGKEEHAAGGDAFGRPHQDDDGGDVDERGREEEERDDEQRFPDLLAR